MPYPTKNSTLEAMYRRVIDSYFWGKDTSSTEIAPLAKNNEGVMVVNAAGTGLVEAFRVDATDTVIFRGGGRVPAVYTLEPTAAIANQYLYIANQPMLVRAIYETHRVAGSSTPTALVVKVPSGTTIANGTPLQTAGFDMAAVANTVQVGALTRTVATLTLAAGDALAIQYAGTLTAIAGVCVTVWMQPLNAPTLDVTFAWNANAQLIDSQFFIANDRYVVTAVRWRHATAGSSTPVAMLTKDTSTNAPGAGTDMLTNTSSTGFNCAAAANVTQVGALVATAATLLLATGDRLSLDFAGTMTALAGVVCTVSLTPLNNRLEIPFYIPSVWSANTDQTFLISDSDYIAVASSEIHAIAAGGTSTAQVTKDSGTDAPGAGVDLLTSADNLNSTAQTVVTNLLVTTLGSTRIRAQDRLAYDFANAVQSSSGLCVTVSLKMA